MKINKCILCPYKHKENCHDNHEKCWTLSNIYYGYVVKIFPFNVINSVKYKYSLQKYERYCKKMDEKYGDYSLETDDWKFIWGVKSWDDLSGADVCMETMNDIDIWFDKKKKKYKLGVETAYSFKDGYDGECKYLKECLNVFANFMDENGLDKNYRTSIFFSDLCTSVEADSIEELYANFKIFVNGFCSQDDFHVVAESTEKGA